jgi:hypothetical protein
MTRSKIRTSGAEGLTLSSTDITIPSGDLIFGSSAKGINLGVTSNTDSNTLDDYEEGSYTAYVHDGSAGAQITLNGTNTTHYTKMGRQVFVSGTANRSDSTGYSSTLLFGLPFASANVTNGAQVCGGVWLDGTGTDIIALVYVPSNSSYAYFKTVDTNDYVVSSQFQNSRPLYTSFFYFVA